jgi:cystathionine beta-synthase
MRVYRSILELIGRSPLIELGRVAREVAPTVLVKAENLEPGGSIKDRTGLAMIDAAERAGVLKPGGTIVEPTAGNTGVGLAQIAAVRGYRCIFVMPDKVSTEKIALLEAYGAEGASTRRRPIWRSSTAGYASATARRF